jgi:hypothetical protein
MCRMIPPSGKSSAFGKTSLRRKRQYPLRSIRQILYLGLREPAGAGGGAGYGDDDLQVRSPWAGASRSPARSDQRTTSMTALP